MGQIRNTTSGNIEENTLYFSRKISKAENRPLAKRQK